MSENERHFCMAILPKTPDADGERRATPKGAVLRAGQWEGGETITIRFLDGSRELQDRVMAAAREWLASANLNFDVRDAGPTDIRISFKAGPGSWSHIGTACRGIPEPEPTMNFGWLTPESTDGVLRQVVLHEFGHAIGFIHEHQNPQGGIQWNKDAVRHDLSGPPNNWDDDTINKNMFKFYDLKDLQMTPVDGRSIMLYPIPAAWTLDKFSAGMNSELSETDKQLAREVYRGR